MATVYYICPQCKKVRSTTFPKMKTARTGAMLITGCSGTNGCGWAGRAKAYATRPKTVS